MNLKIGDTVKIRFDHVEKFMKNWAQEYEETFNIPMERMKIIFSDRFTVTNIDIDDVTGRENYILKSCLKSLDYDEKYFVSKFLFREDSLYKIESSQLNISNWRSICQSLI